MIETELNKVLNYMKQYVENIYEHDSEPMLNYKDLQLVLDEIERLHSIIKEVREYITYARTPRTIYESGYGKGTCVEICMEHLLEILEKVEEKQNG